MTSSAARALDALGDPTRREIVTLLGAHPRSVQDLANHLPVSRPAVSQHLRVLTDADLVSAKPVGARRIYQLHAFGADAVRSYLDQLWDVALSRFALLAENTEPRGDSANASKGITP
ncbi:MAG: metalloregulator ArsR/SmtB family transcription factor [Nocardioidaceae bacterium]